MTALVDTLAYIFSRIAFVNAHAVVVVWIIFVTNDPLDFRRYTPHLLNTLDVDEADLQDCSDATADGIDYAVAWYNTWVFLVVWWLPHSALARNKVKHAIGLGPTHPLDRPIYAFIASITWWAALYLWKPISACSRLDVTTISLTDYLWRAPIVFTFLIEVLGLFYLLPDHVFGTARHTWSSQQMPTKQELLIQFPYAFVRHPAAAAFLWFYWVGIPSYNANHLYHATLWTVFILVGTLVFEEGGLRGQKGEFGKEYAEYCQKVNAFWPSLWSIQHKFGLLDNDSGTKKDKGE